MSNMKIKVALGSLVVVAAIGYLAFAGVKNAQVYYMEVDEFLADANFHDQRVRLCGTVGDQGGQSDDGGLTTTFKLHGRTGQLPVSYRGVVPDMFQAGGEVVVEGRLDEDGTFRAAVLMTKCASKYKPEDYPNGDGNQGGEAAQ